MHTFGRLTYSVIPVIDLVFANGREVDEFLAQKYFQGLQREDTLYRSVVSISGI